MAVRVLLSPLLSHFFQVGISSSNRPSAFIRVAGAATHPASHKVGLEAKSRRNKTFTITTPPLSHERNGAPQNGYCNNARN